MPTQLDRIEKTLISHGKRLIAHGEQLAKVETSLEHMIIERSRLRQSYTGIAKIIGAVGAAIAAVVAALAWMG